MSRSHPSPPDPRGVRWGEASERRAETPPRPRRLQFVGGNEAVVDRAESGGDRRLFCRQSAFPPLPHPRPSGAALLPLRPGGGPGPPGRGCASPRLRAAGCARGPRSRGCGGRSVTWPPRGGSRRGPRGAVPLNPRAAAFVSPRGGAGHEAGAPGWGGGVPGLGGSAGACSGGDLSLPVARDGAEASCCVFFFLWFFN